MYDVATFTLNPSVDHWSEAETVVPVRKVRTDHERIDPGGGGINVSRVVRELGGSTLAVYTAGGYSGDALVELVGRCGFDQRAVGIAGTTRMSHTVLDRSKGAEYRFVPEGPAASPEEVDRFLAAVEECRARYAVLSGSLPAGADPALAGEIVRRARRGGALCVADLSGPALRVAIGAGLHLVKPNRRELEALVGRDLPAPRDRIDACRRLVDTGDVEMVALTLGSEGAMLVTGEGVVELATPKVEVRSAVGAGDSFVAGMVMGLARGLGCPRAFAQGVAAGAAAATTPATELCHRADVERLFDDIVRGQLR